DEPCLRGATHLPRGGRPEGGERRTAPDVARGVPSRRPRPDRHLVERALRDSLRVPALDDPAPRRAAGRPLVGSRLAGLLGSPRTAFFGDTVTASVEFAGDTRTVVPGSVRFDGRFADYALVAHPTVDRNATGNTEYVVWTASLRCLRRACVPGTSHKRVHFPP